MSKEIMKKEIKRGCRSFAKPMVCGVSFEELPAWLWVLRPVEWSVILISEHDDVRLRRSQPELYTRIGDRVQVMQTHRGTHDTLAVEARVWWISGTVEFVNSLGVVPPGVPKVAWVTKAPRRPPRESSKEDQWITLSHSKVGGTTTSRGVFCLSNLDRVDISSDLTRNIGHIVKFSIRSKSCPETLLEPHYTLNSKLNVRRLDLPLLLPSDFSGTGWGQRVLEPQEIAAAFDLPDFVPWNSLFSELLVPLQLLRALMDQVIRDLVPPSSNPKSRRRLARDTDHASTPPVDGIWLPDLQRWLPGSWADIKIADKAVKDDGAEVNTHPWHQRVSLVLPCTPQALKTISMFLMRRWRHNIVHSFFLYLAREYGPNWVHRLRSSPNRKRNSPEASGRDGGYSSCAIKTSGEGSIYRVTTKPEEGKKDLDKSDYRELGKDLTVGLPILGQVLQSTWWEWTSGSSLFFWRWNGKEQIRASRDGIQNFVQGRLPKRRAMKPLRLSDTAAKLVSMKITGMVQRTYLSVGFVKSSLHFFAVPKGMSDVRIVYDGTSCGLNEAIWAPNFYLPTSKAAALMLSFGSWMADSDFGEMFHNFPMENRIRQHAGVDLCSLKGHETSKPLRWSRLFMGMRSSPYNAVRHYYWGEEFARGNPKQVNNPMGYSRVRLNLPGLLRYDPMLPKVMKWQDGSDAGDETGSIAGDVITFVDDVRIVGNSKENCRSVHRQFVSRMQYLGLQDAPRKFRPPSQTTAGAWTGTIFRITRNAITKSVSEESGRKERRY